jgi:hypothetical protein
MAIFAAEIKTDIDSDIDPISVQYRMQAGILPVTAPLLVD